MGIAPARATMPGGDRVGPDARGCGPDRRSCSRAAPSCLIPVPASRTSRPPSDVRTSMQDVLPPKPTVASPGVASDPRAPQIVARSATSPRHPGRRDDRDVGPAACDRCHGRDLTTRYSARPECSLIERDRDITRQRPRRTSRRLDARSRGCNESPRRSTETPCEVSRAALPQTRTRVRS
jgi:hypothetical protein